MRVKFYRNIFIENIVKDLEYSSLNKGINFEISDYSNIFNQEMFKNYEIVIFIIDFSKIKNKKVYLKEIKKNFNYLKKQNINYLFFYYSENNLVTDKYSCNLKNTFSLNSKKKLLKKSIFFDNKSYLKLTNLIQICLAIFTPYKLRGIAFDLDNTLWDGIIGEDTKIKINNFQKKNLILINKLIEKGFLISLISKNNLIDVRKFMNKSYMKKIFNKSKKYISWDDKSNSMNKLIRWSKLNQSNFLFFDDNENEILRISQNFPKMLISNAKDHGIIFFILNIINNLSKKNKVSSLRRIDLENNEKRKKLQSKSITEFIKSTSPKVVIFKNSTKQVNRIVEMSNKINQFNLSDERYDKKQINFFLKSKAYDIYTFNLKDRFGDSGIIGYLLIYKFNNQIQIKDIKISCRALGRDLEIFFINKVLLKNDLNKNDIILNYRKTNRNKPVNNILIKNFNNLKKIKKNKIKNLKYFNYVQVRFC